MSEEDLEETEQEEAVKKPSKIKAIAVGAASTVLLGGVAMAVVYFAPIQPRACVANVDVKKGHGKNIESVKFINLDPLIISLGPSAKSKYLKISISIETARENEKMINELTPRFRDVLNSYLRAVDESDLIEPAAMTRLRAQILRRVQLVASPDAVIDVLITDFVLT